MRSWWMTNRRALGFVLRAAFAAMVVIVALARGAAASGTGIRIAVVERDDDGFYEKVDGADGLYREQRHRPFPGAELGRRTSRRSARPPTSLTFSSIFPSRPMPTSPRP